MSSKRWTALIIAIALFILSIGVQLTGNRNSTDQTDNPLLFQDATFKERSIKKGIGNKKIVVLNLEGVIQDIGSVPFMNTIAYDHKRFLKMIEQAADDPTVSGVILKVNSPGGGVVESAEIHDKLAELQHTFNKPLYVSMGNTAASGGYYVSAPAEKIFAHPATLTGSIGVIMENVDISELADTYGIDFNTIKSGEFKDIMSPTRPMTDEEHDILQSMIDDLYDDFVDVIAEGRDMPEDKVRDLGDGRIYTGKQAQEHGLVDELGTLDDTIEVMKDEHNLKGARVVEYEPAISIGQLIGFTAKNVLSADNEFHNLLTLVKESSGPRLLYLYSR